MELKFTSVLDILPIPENLNTLQEKIILEFVTALDSLFFFFFVCTHLSSHIHVLSVLTREGLNKCLPIILLCGTLSDFCS